MQSYIADKEVSPEAIRTLLDCKYNLESVRFKIINSNLNYVKKLRVDKPEILSNEQSVQVPENFIDDGISNADKMVPINICINEMTTLSLGKSFTLDYLFDSRCRVYV